MYPHGEWDALALMAVQTCRRKQPMVTLAIRNLDEPIKAQLRIQAARHGRSTEEETRMILRDAIIGRCHSRQQLIEGKKSFSRR